MKTDHQQLPPTIKSPRAEQQGLGITLFSRLTERYKEKVTKMLTIQYRMHEVIMKWSSEQFYEGRLIADEYDMIFFFGQKGGKNFVTNQVFFFLDFDVGVLPNTC